MPFFWNLGGLKAKRAAHEGPRVGSGIDAEPFRTIGC
jgi:hypothetical protein